MTEPGAPRPSDYAPFIAGLRAAREVVERQTDLTELIHFERPSDYRKGVLTCLMALTATIEAYEKASQSDDSTYESPAEIHSPAPSNPTPTDEGMS